VISIGRSGVFAFCFTRVCVGVSEVRDYIMRSFYGRALKSSRGRARSDALVQMWNSRFSRWAVVRHGFCPSLAVDRVITCASVSRAGVTHRVCKVPRQSHQGSAGEMDSESARGNAFLQMLCWMRADGGVLVQVISIQQTDMLPRFWNSVRARDHGCSLKFPSMPPMPRLSSL
jgi:hypothetical protein